LILKFTKSSEKKILNGNKSLYLSGMEEPTTVPRVPMALIQEPIDFGVEKSKPVSSPKNKKRKRDNLFLEGYEDVLKKQSNKPILDKYQELRRGGKCVAFVEGDWYNGVVLRIHKSGEVTVFSNQTKKERHDRLPRNFVFGQKWS
jgi:hypothetical protein